MAITFALRGNSKTAFRAVGDAAAAQVGTVTIAAGGIDSLIDMDQAAGAIAQHSLIYKGAGNLPTGQQMSILLSFSVAAATDVAQLFYLGGPTANWGNQSRTSGSNTLATSILQKTTGASIAAPNTAWTPVATTIYDVLYTLDGSLTTAALNTYVDAVLLATTNASATRAAIDVGNLQSFMIILGAQNTVAQNSTRIKVREMVIWDTIIDPTAVTLTTGAGSLNGAARVAYVEATALNGAVTSGGAFTYVS